jgi:hypothetical protein
MIFIHLETPLVTWFSIVVFLVTPIVAQTDFHGIVPMKSTRNDVIKILGKPNKYGRYDLKDGSVSFYFRPHECSKNEGCACNVPEDTVLTIEIKPAQTIKFDTLKLNLAEFIMKDVSDHVPGIRSYSNTRTGVTYYVSNNIVREIAFTGNEKSCFVSD